jgi:hypothetical protein
MEDIEQKEDEIEVGEEIHDVAFTHPWRTIFGGAVAELYFCNVYIKTVAPKTKYTNVKKRMVFVGKPHNREVAISMFLHLESTINRLARERYEGRGDIAAFERGCGLELARRIRDHVAALRANRVSPSDSRMLALYDTEKKAVKDYTDKLHLQQGGVRKFNTHTEAAQHGKREAHNISFADQVSANRVRAIR